MPGMMITGSDGIPHRVFVTVRRNDATRPKLRKSKTEVEEEAPRPKMNKSFSMASSSSSGKTTPPRQNSLQKGPAAPQGIRAG